jgi:2-methylisocitrate lyase-like PEP mutase family enzyme
MESKGKALREIFQEQPVVVAPGAFDAYSAVLIERAGFPVVYMSGAGISHSLLGKPDIGYVSYGEMVTTVNNISSAISVPLVADGDNGYGGPLQVIRTVEGYIKCGAAAIQLEDQVTPKRCGFMRGKELISKADAVAKIKAAAYARDKFDEDFVIVARTDALAVNGIKDALDRANAFVEAGADVIYVEAPPTKEMMQRIGKEVNCKWLMTIHIEGISPLLSKEELKELGFKFIIHPACLMSAVNKTMQTLLKKFKEEESIGGCLDMMMDASQNSSALNLEELRKLEESLTEPPEDTAKE